MRKKERYEKILAWFRENRPIAETELHYNNSRPLPGLPHSRSACSHYSGSSIRIHTQCILPEQ